MVYDIYSMRFESTYHPGNGEVEINMTYNNDAVLSGSQ